MLGGKKEQDTCAGTVPQEKLTVPVKSPAGVSVMVKVPELPDLMGEEWLTENNAL
jgi:hypothetical protein